MCLLSYFPAGVLPNADALRCGARCNNDGHGFGIVIPGQDNILIFKSMDPTEAVDAFVAARAKHPDGPALFHSRLTTHGNTNVDNCHPFVVNGDPRTVVAHNGILPHDAHPGKIGTAVKIMTTKDGTPYEITTGVYDHRSDTRILADDLLMKRWPSLDSRHTRKRLTSWLGRGNKILVLTTDPNYRRTSYLFNAELGEWVGGVWYSNSSFRGYGRGGSGYASGYGAGWSALGRSSYGSSDLGESGNPWYGNADGWESEWDDEPLYRGEASYGYVKNDRGVWVQVPRREAVHPNDDPQTWPTTLGGTRTGAQGKAGFSATPWVTFVTCDLCGAQSVDADYGLCYDCYSCNDCAEYIGRCECYGTPYLQAFAYSRLIKALDDNATSSTIRNHLKDYRRVCATFQGLRDKRRDAALHAAKAEPAPDATVDQAVKAIAAGPATQEVISATIASLQAMADAPRFSDSPSVGVSSDGSVSVEVSNN